MPLDPAVLTLIDGLAAQGFTSFHEIGVEGTRAVVATFTGLQEPHREVGKALDAVYSGPGGEQQLRIYVPEGDGPFPTVVYFHGGGFVAGGIDVAEERARALAADAATIVVTPAYRLAPEHRFPAAPEDAFAALAWTRDNIGAFGGDPTRLALMGDSAGGNLAAVTAQRARDAGIRLAAQVLVYPVVAPGLDGAPAFPSRRECGYIISDEDLRWFWSQYLQDPADAASPLASPAAGELAGLPPTLILTTELEASRDEAEDYASRLSAAGVETEAIRVEGLVHGAYWMSAAVPRSAELHEAVVRFLRNRL